MSDETRAALREVDQRQGRSPAVCVKTGVPTDRATRVRATALAHAERWEVAIGSTLTVLTARLLRQPTSQVVLAVAEEPWRRWRRRLGLAAALLVCGLGAIVAGALAEKTTLIPQGVLLARPRVVAAASGLAHLLGRPVHHPRHRRHRRDPGPSGLRGGGPPPVPGLHPPEPLTHLGALQNRQLVVVKRRSSTYGCRMAPDSPGDPIRLDDLIVHVIDLHPDGDALDHLSDAVETSSHLGEVADHLIGHFVDQARRSGASWTEIGQYMGVSKQAVQKRFVPKESDELHFPPGGRFSRFTMRARHVVAESQARPSCWATTGSSTSTSCSAC